MSEREVEDRNHAIPRRFFAIQLFYFALPYDATLLLCCAAYDILRLSHEMIDWTTQNKRIRYMSLRVFQELKIRAQLDPVVRRKLAAHPLRFLANFDLSFDEKRDIVLPHFTWIVENRLASMPFPSTEDAYIVLQQIGIKVILNLTEYLDDTSLLSAFTVYQIHIASFKDWGHKPPTLQQMQQAVSIIQTSLKSNQPILVHCVHGLGRTGTIIAGYLITCGLTAQEAIDRIRKLRPGSIETEEQEAVIYEYERTHHSNMLLRDTIVPHVNHLFPE